MRMSSQSSLTHFDDKKLNVKTAESLGLCGKSDEAVYAEAWRQRRLLLSYDDAFYNNDRRFPFQACAGLIVLPPNAGQSVGMVNTVGELVPVFSRGRELWWYTKIRLKQDQATVRTWERGEGKIEVTRYRIHKHGEIQYWDDN